ncbi:hypothetical protein brsh051_09630 [Brooklawnia propionicigenes]|uniref:Uncharacterized protein n=1 Tax=Brooklawnia propionicigenes TaxID=3041175 RepID=A0AAN0K6D6_9ACTN|nr:hypothetical protein brsh051_09630 [Brooklawnia sp. SH051]
MAQRVDRFDGDEFGITGADPDAEEDVGARRGLGGFAQFDSLRSPQPGDLICRNAKASRPGLPRVAHASGMQQGGPPLRDSAGISPASLGTRSGRI